MLPPSCALSPKYTAIVIAAAAAERLLNYAYVFLPLPGTCASVFVFAAHMLLNPAQKPTHTHTYTYTSDQFTGGKVSHCCTATQTHTHTAPLSFHHPSLNRAAERKRERDRAREEIDQG